MKKLTVLLTLCVLLLVPSPQFEVSRYWWLPPGGDEPTNVTGMLQWLEGTNSGYVELEACTISSCPGCKYVCAEFGIYMVEQLSEMVVFLAHIEIGDPPNWVVWRNIGWERRHHRIWASFTELEQGHYTYIIYDCDTDEILAEGTFWTSYTGHLGGLALSLEHYEPYYDAVGIAEWHTADGDDWVDRKWRLGDWQDMPDQHQQAKMIPIVAHDCTGPNHGSRVAELGHLTTRSVPPIWYSVFSLPIPSSQPILPTQPPLPQRPTSATQLAPRAYLPFVGHYAGAEWYQLKGWWTK